MDQDWAIGVLEEWIDLGTRAHGTTDSVAVLIGAKTDELREREQQAREVIAHTLYMRVLPDLIEPFRGRRDLLVLKPGIELAKRALGQVRRGAETQAKLGSTAPTMAADALHPLIWGSASKL